MKKMKTGLWHNMFQDTKRVLQLEVFSIRGFATIKGNTVSAIHYTFIRALFGPAIYMPVCYVKTRFTVLNWH